MKNLVFVGGFSETIELFELTINLSSPEETHLKNISSTNVGKNPAFLALNNHGLYCVHEVRMRLLIITSRLVAKVSAASS